MERLWIDTLDNYHSARILAYACSCFLEPVALGIIVICRMFLHMRTGKFFIL